MKRALVLSGGGARGAYELGVWRAFDEIGITFDIVTGTSIGALNGVIYAQQKLAEAEQLWNAINPTKVISTDEKDPKKFLVELFGKAVLGGADPTPLEKMVRGIIDENEVRKSKIRFGVVVVNFPSMKPELLTIDEIPQGKLIDYVMASASAYPLFRPKDIDDRKMIDGGFYDNMPLNLAVRMGAEEIVAIDLKAIGITRKIENKSVKVHLIEPSKDLGSFMLFDKDLVKRNEFLGYTDTMKKFGGYHGKNYVFKRGSYRESFKLILHEFYSLCDYVYPKNSNKTAEFFNLIAKVSPLRLPVAPDIITSEINPKHFKRSMEIAGKILGIDEYVIYDFDTYAQAILAKVDSEAYMLHSIDINMNIIVGIDSKDLTYNLLGQMISKPPLQWEFQTYMRYSETMVAALFIYAVMNHRDHFIKKDDNKNAK